MLSKIINGREIAQEIKKNIKSEIENLSDGPCVVSIVIGSNPESDLYLKLRDKACEQVGIFSKHVKLDDDVTQEKIIQNIKKLNMDKKVHGILLQFPIPSHLDSDKIINEIIPRKDVEGITPFNLGNTLRGLEEIVPCTPLAVIKILESINVNFKGKNVVIINHSNIVGKPLSALFLNRNSTVCVCNIFTKDLKAYTTKADILITATGVPGLIKKEYIKKDAIVIDVGINKTDKGICGDVDFNSVKDTAGFITPVPGGVGPVTIACSVENIFKIFKKINF